MQYDPIQGQGQGHEPLVLVICVSSRVQSFTKQGWGQATG